MPGNAFAYSILDGSTSALVGRNNREKFDYGLFSMD
jgi:hypothetical protein